MEDDPKQSGTGKAIRVALSLFSRRELTKLSFFTCVQMVLGFLDLIGVALLGLLGSLAVSGVQSTNATGKVLIILDLLKIDDLTIQRQVAAIGLLAALILATKTVISLIITRRNLNFLSLKSASVSIQLIQRLMQKNLLQIQEKSSQENLVAVSQGVSSLITVVLGSLLAMVADLALLIILFSGMLAVNVVTALTVFIFFTAVGVILHYLLSGKVYKLSSLQLSLSMNMNRRILEIVNAYRELVVTNRRDYYLDEITHIRNSAARVEGKLAFVPNISKYAMDISLILGALMITGLQFSLNDARHAVASLLVFVVASMRIGPAILRIQQGVLAMRNGVANSVMTVNLVTERSFHEYEVKPERLRLPREKLFEHFNPSISIRNLNFSYLDNPQWKIQDMNLEVEKGKIVAIIGPSGGGKSTLVDLLLGIFPPESGEILISELPPVECFDYFPGAVAYVPQAVYISEGSILENVAFGYDRNKIDRARVWRSLELANLSDFVDKLPNKLDSKVGEFGSKLSGGQRQRLGIARALYTSPKLLILDEATSALDTNSEFQITQSIRSFKGSTTVLMIAHRLSSIAIADEVIYIENGNIGHRGTYEETLLQFPNLSRESNKFNE